jgi:glutathione S-transferase
MTGGAAVELFHSPISTCSQKVRLALAEKRLDYVDRMIDFTTLEHLSPSYLAINPNGVVPAIRHQGVAVIDSSVICEYLDEVFPDPPLSPSTAPGRAAMRAWLRYLEEVPTVAIRVPSFNAFFAAPMRAMGEAAFEAMRSRMPLRRQFYARMGDAGFDAAETGHSMERLHAALERAEAALAKGPWLLGEQFTIADIAYAPTIVRMADLGLAPMWDHLPGIAGWYDRLQRRRSFAVAYYPGCRIDRDRFRFAMRPEGVPA